MAVTGSKAGYTTATKTSAATAKVATATLTAPVPTITGTPTVGNTLTAVPGTWCPAGVELSYQWSADGTKIDGATKTTLDLQSPAHAGKAITVAVTGTKAGYTTAVDQHRDRQGRHLAPHRTGPDDHRHPHRRATRSPRSRAPGPGRRGPGLPVVRRRHRDRRRHQDHPGPHPGPRREGDHRGGDRFEGRLHHRDEDQRRDREGRHRDPDRTGPDDHRHPDRGQHAHRGPRHLGTGRRGTGLPVVRRRHRDRGPPRPPWTWTPTLRARPSPWR